MCTATSRLVLVADDAKRLRPHVQRWCRRRPAQTFRCVRGQAVARWRASLRHLHRWQRVELDLSGAGVEQAYEQSDKNALIDAPVKSVHVVWFTEAAGATSLTVDAIIAVTRLENVSGRGLSIDTSVSEIVEPGAKPTASLVATNFTSECPLDFVEVINVHFYSGQEPPETCKTDGNARVTSATTFADNLRELSAWRDRYAPAMPIWMTETGYDSAGPFGTTEAIQAARLARVVMLCLANGVDKVFVYRESGSTPSMHACSGVLRNDSSRKPSWYTFGTLIRQLHGVTGGARRLPHPDPNVWLMEWDAGGEPLLTAWTVDGTAAMGLDLGAVTVIDSFGGIRKPRSTADVRITAYPVYLRNFARSEPLQKLRDELKRRDAAKAVRLRRIAALRKYLFDFGSSEQVGRDNIEGHRSDYVAVLASTVWDAARGYGFDKAAFRDEDRLWLKNQKLDRDSSRVRDHLFKYRVAPGEYDLTMKVVPFSEQGQLTITGVVGGPLTLSVQKKIPVTSVRIRVTGERPVVGIRVENDYGHFTWVRCVETME